MLLAKNDPLELLENFSFCFSLEKVLVSSLGVLCSNIWPTVAVTHGCVCYSQSSSSDVSIYLLLAASRLSAVLGITLFPLMLYLPTFTLFLCVLWLAQSQFLSLVVWSFHQRDHGLSTCPFMIDKAQGPPAVYYASANLKSLMEVIFLLCNWLLKLQTLCLAIMSGSDFVFMCDLSFAFFSYPGLDNSR